MGYQRPGTEEVQLVFLFPLWFWLCKTGLSLKIPCIQNLLLLAHYAPWRPWSTSTEKERKLGLGSNCCMIAMDSYSDLFTCLFAGAIGEEGELPLSLPFRSQ